MVFVGSLFSYSSDSPPLGRCAFPNKRTLVKGCLEPSNERLSAAADFFVTFLIVVSSLSSGCEIFLIVFV